MERLIYDTSVLIAAARGRLDLADLGSDDADAAVPAIVVAEYLTGVHLARTDELRSQEQAFLDRVLDTLPVEDYTQRVAEHHSELLAHVRKTGQRPGPHDLIIAATARSSHRTILSTDKRAKFDKLPGVTAHLI